jgi:hypothetical protein
LLLPLGLLQLGSGGIHLAVLFKQPEHRIACKALSLGRLRRVQGDVVEQGGDEGEEQEGQ